MYSNQHLVCLPGDRWFHWGQVLPSDESRFSLLPSSRNNPQFVLEMPQYEAGDIIVWAGISTEGHTYTDLYFIENCTLNIQRYLPEILRRIVLP